MASYIPSPVGAAIPQPPTVRVLMREVDSLRAEVAQLRGRIAAGLAECDRIQGNPAEGATWDGRFTAAALIRKAMTGDPAQREARADA